MGSRTRTRVAEGYVTNTRIALCALFLGSFVIGTTEFVTMGLLPGVADTYDVSIPTAGRAVTAYALGVVIGAPLLTVVGTRIPQHLLLVGLMCGYGACNLLTAAAPDFAIFGVSRLLGGMPHGVYAGIASLVAARMVSSSSQARAVATVIAGMAVGAVFGVPVATWVGQSSGWRVAFAGAGLLALVLAAMIARTVPPEGDVPPRSGVTELRGLLTRPQILLTLTAGAVGFGGMFAVYSYIAKTVTAVGELSSRSVPVFLFVFGVGMLAGTWAGARLAAWSVGGSLLLALVASSASLLAFHATAPFGFAALPASFLITLWGSVLVVALQLRLMEVAGPAAALAASMNHASLNVGNALGAYAGGVTIAAGYGYRATATTGAVLATAGCLIVLLALALDRGPARG